jgi:signal transduction histidine kinase
MRPPGSSTVLLVATCVMAAADVAVTARYGTDPSRQYVMELANVAAWTLGGIVATRVRPGNRIGMLMLRLGFIFALNNSAGDQLATRAWPATLLVTIATFATPVQWAAAIHTTLAFPSGRPIGRSSVWLIRAGYGWSLFGPVVVVVGRVDNGCSTCAAPAGLGLLTTTTTGALLRLDQTVFIGLIVATTVVYCRQLIAGSPRQRRVLAYPSAGLFVASAFAVGVLILNPPAHAGVRGLEVPIVLGLELAAAAAMPLGFVLGLARERLDRARVSDLVVQLAHTPVAALGPALAQALGDPHAQLVTTTEVDQKGRPAPADGTRFTPVGDPAAPVAFLRHDSNLDTQPDLLASVSAAVGLALDNARLREEILAQLAEVRASRERLVEAGDTARRRLERDLHDGAQQQLIALGLSLRLIRQRLGSLDADTLALFEETQTQTRAAIRDLRDLARGLHPAVLTEQGLAVALEQLAGRCPVPVHLEVPDCLPALPDAAQVTAYYVASEALANVAKHAAASNVWLRVTTSDGGLGLCITDDGVGGVRATPGSGLTGLADRVAAIGGRLTIDSEPGRGTRIEAHIPNFRG